MSDRQTALEVLALAEQRLVLTSLRVSSIPVALEALALLCDDRGRLERVLREVVVDAPARG